MTRKYFIQSPDNGIISISDGQIVVHFDNADLFRVVEPDYQLPIDAVGLTYEWIGDMLMHIVQLPLGVLQDYKTVSAVYEGYISKADSYAQHQKTINHPLYGLSDLNQIRSKMLVMYQSISPAVRQYHSFHSKILIPMWLECDGLLDEMKYASSNAQYESVLTSTQLTLENKQEVVEAAVRDRLQLKTLAEAAIADLFGFKKQLDQLSTREALVELFDQTFGAF